MKIDVVIPFFNEAPCVRHVVDNMLQACVREAGHTFRFLLVDDGSTDDTGRLLDSLAAEHTCIRVIHLWGNHGHQKALVAGLDHAGGDAVLMMDGDGQHDAATAMKMVNILAGNAATDMVQAVRTGRQPGILKNMTSRLFYRATNMLMTDLSLCPGAFDFRVIRSSVSRLLKQYPDRHRNLRVLLAALKLRTCFVEYDAGVRVAGTSRYAWRQMLALALDGWFAFSLAPLRLSFLLMLGSWLVVGLYLVYVLIMFATGNTVPGWASLVMLVVFLFSAVFGVLAIMSEYVARIYSDLRRHPVYRVKEQGERGMK